MNNFLYQVGAIINVWIFNILNYQGFIFWGSSGGSAPKPDPQIGRAALETAQIGRDAFEFYKQEYINNKPNQDRLNQIATKVQEQLLASGEKNQSYADDYYKYNIDTFRPLEKSIVDNANNYDTLGRRETEAAKGISDVKQAFDIKRDSANRNNERRGINPNSGNALALNSQMDTQEAIASADAANKGRTRAEMTGIALKTDAASLGRNLPANQVNSQTLANSAGTSAVNVGLADAQNGRAGLSVYGAGVDAATRGLTNSANILQNQYNGQVQAAQANQQSNDNAWGGIGSLVGAGISAWSDQNIKKNIKPVDDDEMLEGIEKTPIKNWQYDANKVAGLDSLKHVGGMAQDLQKNLGDEVSDGKKVDIISAIGANMAATRALSKKVDELAEMRTKKKMAGGGYVKGKGTPTSDSIDAKLSDGEFVMNQGAVKMLGLDTMNDINQRGLKYRGAK